MLTCCIHVVYVHVCSVYIFFMNSALNMCSLNVHVHVCMYMYTGLRKKTVAPGAGGLDDHLRSTGSTDLFGSADAIVKHLLEVS